MALMNVFICFVATRRRWLCESFGRGKTVNDIVALSMLTFFFVI